MKITVEYAPAPVTGVTLELTRDEAEAVANVLNARLEGALTEQFARLRLANPAVYRVAARLEEALA